MTKAQDLGPLDWRIAITDQAGRPTPEFQRRWAIQRANNALIGTITFGAGVPISLDPAEGAEYVNTASVPYILYVGHNKTWHQVGVDTFLQLADAPSSYVGQGGKFVAVNSGATGLTFVAAPTSNSNSRPGFDGDEGPEGPMGPPGPPGPTGPAGASAGTAMVAVQSTVNAHNVTDGSTVEIHLTNTPTVGNLLVFACLLYDANGSPSVPTGLTLDTGIDNGVYYQVLLYRYVQAGDGKNWQLDNSGRNFWSAAAWEYSGVKGTWAQDHIATHVGLAAAFPNTTGSITGFNTVNANELIGGFWGGNCGSGGMTSTITQSGQVDDGQYNGTDGTLCYAHANHVPLIGTSGTLINASLTITQSADISYVYYEMASANSSIGPAGPMGFPGLPGSDGEEGPEGPAIPGPAGAQGKPGIQGMMGLDGMDGDDIGPLFVPSGVFFPLTGGAVTVPNQTTFSTPMFSKGVTTLGNNNANYMTIFGNSSGNSPGLNLQGSDTNVSLQINPKGTGGVTINGGFNVVGFSTFSLGAYYGNGSANYMAVGGNTTGNAPFFAATGSDTNIGIGLICKGTGSVIITGPTQVSGGQQIANAAGAITGIQASPYSQQVPLTGFTITVGNAINYLILNPAGTLATGTVTMPAAPQDGHEVTVSSSQIITALTVSANVGQTIFGGLTAVTFAANSFAKWKYVLSTTTWNRVG